MRAVLRLFFFFSSRRRHTRCSRDWSSDVCSSDLIVQYQQYPFVSGSFAPYRLAIARPHDRVTDETAPVTPLDPASRVFHVPNEIVPEDWQGWVQERDSTSRTTGTARTRRSSRRTMRAARHCRADSSWPPSA